MAKMIDPIPVRDGEADTWRYLSDNLPKQYIVYNTRSVHTWEFDFCVLAPSQGLFILEVKGWTADYILNVLNGKQILLNDSANPIVGSPRDQARGYCFDLVNLFRDNYGFNPLVLDVVCYPYISKEEFYKKRLDVISSETETIFKEELMDKTALLKKLNDRFLVAESIKHDYMDNGYNFSEIKNLKHLDDLDSIHLSRHMINDYENNRIFGIPVVSSAEIKDIVSGLSDPAKVVFTVS